MEDDAVQETEFSNEEEDEEEMTAGTAYLAFHCVWLNEKFAPELLQHQSNLVECMVQQAAHMEENIKRLDKRDWRLMVHKIEIDRIRFIVASYLRTRLEKIERYTVNILSQETNRTPKDRYLMPSELQFAKEFLTNMETLFRTIALQHMRGNFRTFESQKLMIKPNTRAYVFMRANEKLSGLFLPGYEDEEFDVEDGSQYIIRYDAIAHLLKNGSVQLI